MFVHMPKVDIGFRPSTLSRPPGAPLLRRLAWRVGALGGWSGGHWLPGAQLRGRAPDQPRPRDASPPAIWGRGLGSMEDREGSRVWEVESRIGVWVFVRLFFGLPIFLKRRLQS